MKTLLSIGATILFFVLMFMAPYVAGAQSFMGKMSKTAIMKDGPGKEYHKVISLTAGSRIFVYEATAQQGYISVVDLATNTQGYVEKTFVKLLMPVDANAIQKPAFTRVTDIDNEEVAMLELSNRTPNQVMVKLDDMTIKVAPYGSMNMKMAPGTHAYYAFQQMNNPKVGSYEFEPGKSYKWDFMNRKKDNRTFSAQTASAEPVKVQ
ncbi:MAG: hypothetical protein V4543_15280 [Bacteroidota bacterium]